MSRLKIIIALAAVYFVFAILLNSVGAVILQSINTFGISEAKASTLEGFKDIPIAICSFVLASFIPRIGYKIAMLIALAIVTVACIFATSINAFWVMQALFAAVGVSFALVKVSVYSIIGQLTQNADQHSSLMNLIEGIFMCGVLSGYWLFGFYIDAENSASSDWLNVYFPLMAILIGTILLLVSAPIAKDEISQSNSNIEEVLNMVRLAYKPLVLVFVISVFLYVLIEQGVGTWLPTFNNKVLELPADIAVTITSIFAAMVAIGRLSAGLVLRYISWFSLLIACLICMALILFVGLPLASDLDSSLNLAGLPIAALVLPTVGLFMAPIYPVINSVMLSALPKSKQAQMTGLIIVFSALGGTTGSLITGALFGMFDGTTAFYFIPLPIACLLISLLMFRRLAILNTAKQATR